MSSTALCEVILHAVLVAFISGMDMLLPVCCRWFQVIFVMVWRWMWLYRWCLRMLWMCVLCSNVHTGDVCIFGDTCGWCAGGVSLGVGIGCGVCDVHVDAAACYGDCVCVLMMVFMSGVVVVLCVVVWCVWMC